MEAVTFGARDDETCVCDDDWAVESFGIRESSRGPGKLWFACPDLSAQQPRCLENERVAQVGENDVIVTIRRSMIEHDRSELVGHRVRHVSCRPRPRAS
jgi:hypothetical protein